MKNARLAMIEQGRTDPQRLATQKLQRQLAPYAKDDVRYVPTTDEEIDRLKATTVEQVRSLYRDFLGASNGELVIVGDFEPSEILPIMQNALKDWTSSKPYARIERPIPPGITTIREIIDTPDKANANYMAGVAIAVKNDDPDYPALVAGNFILGGGALASRLGNRLRKKRAGPMARVRHLMPMRSMPAGRS